MQIQRYLVKDNQKCERFGGTYMKREYDIIWHYGGGKIGMSRSPTSESENFIKGFLVDEDSLVIGYAEDGSLHIKRKNNPIGRLNQNYVGLEGLNKLIEMVRSRETIFSFNSLSGGRNTFNILTFSLEEPSSEFYRMGTIMPVEFRK